MREVKFTRNFTMGNGVPFRDFPHSNITHIPKYLGSFSKATKRAMAHLGEKSHQRIHSLFHSEPQNSSLLRSVYFGKDSFLWRLRELQRVAGAEFSKTSVLHISQNSTYVKGVLHPTLGDVNSPCPFLLAFFSLETITRIVYFGCHQTIICSTTALGTLMHCQLLLERQKTIANANSPPWRWTK